MHQEADFRCVPCKAHFELTVDQIDDLLASGAVACAQCHQVLDIKESDRAKLIRMKGKNLRAGLVFGCLTVGVPLANIVVVMQWGSGMGFISFFISLLLMSGLLPLLKDGTFIRLELDKENKEVSHDR